MFKTVDSRYLRTNPMGDALKTFSEMKVSAIMSSSSTSGIMRLETAETGNSENVLGKKVCVP
jgi:hypothetical protein